VIREFFVWVRVFLSRRRDGELEEELGFHIEQSIEQKIAAGMIPIEARRQALIEFGGVERTREECVEKRPGWLLDSVWQDIRYAVRGFRRNPLFTVTVIVTLALGIGTTTAVFSVVDRILFRSLPYAHDDRLVSVGLVQSLERQEFMLGGFFYEWRDDQKPFESLSFERGVNECNVTEANPVRLHCAAVAANFLPTLGVSPVLGRNFLPEEDLPASPKVALISYGLWLSRYNRDAGVLNKAISIDDHLVRVVGVLPKDFEMPRLQATDIVVPAAVDVAAQHTVNSGIGYPMWAFARLKPGVNLAEARAEMEPLFRKTQLWIPAQIRGDFKLQVRSVRDRQMQSAYRAAWILLGAVSAVLLIACANVASLFMARGAARERELAVRMTLGATRNRLVRQTLIEAFLLAFAGAFAGCILAEILLRAFIAIAPTGVPFLIKAHLDLRIVLFTIAVSLVCSLLFGMIPALQMPRMVALAARATNSGAHARVRRILVSFQIAMCVVLLAGASLLFESFRNLEHQSLGMETHDVLVVHIPLTSARYQTGQAYMAFYLRVEQALRQVPGITTVGISDSLPPDADSWHDGVRLNEMLIDGKAVALAGTGGTAVVRRVTPGYFGALGVPIVEGRGFTEEERSSSSNFMILSKLLATRLFPQTDPIGRQIRFAVFRPYLAVDGPVFTVVGVAGNVKNAGLAGQDDPEYYTLRRNRDEDWSGHCVFVLETTLPNSIVAPWIRTRVAHFDSTAPVEIEGLTQSVSKLADRPRFETALLGFFALSGLVMAIVGLYGVIAFVATQRTKEIGVRMALGATRFDVLRLITGEGVRLIIFGGAIGLVAALGLAQLLKSLLFGITPHDFGTYLAVTLLLIVVALAATLIPARAAMKVDPMEALHYE